MTLAESHQRQRLSGARHGDVIETAWRVRVLVDSRPLPAAVQHDDVIELQPLGTVRGHQQQTALAATDFPSPLGQPLDETSSRRFFAAGFQGVLVYGFPQQRDPRPRSVGSQPSIQLRFVHEARSSFP